jgi:hypothetical protein
MAASTPTTSAGGADAPGPGRGAGGGGVQARQPRIHAAMPWAMTNPAPSPARPPPAANAAARTAS